MYMFNIPGYGVFIVDGGTKVEAIRRLQARLRETNPNLLNAPAITSALDAGRVVRPTEIPAGATLIRAGEPGETLPLDELPGGVPGGSGEEGLGAGGGGNSSGNNPTGNNPSSGGTSVVGAGSLGVDVQTFPFSSFANALKDRGFDARGVLGATFDQGIFDPAIRAAEIGRFTGTLAPMGTAPGAQEQFFANLLSGGARNLPQQVLDDLRSGGSAIGLDAGQSAALSQFRAPTLGTDTGNASARAVLELARAASNQKYGAIGSRFLPGTNDLLSRFQDPLAQGQQPDFLSFATSQFGV